MTLSPCVWQVSRWGGRGKGGQERMTMSPTCGRCGAICSRCGATCSWCGGLRKEGGRGGSE